MVYKVAYSLVLAVLLLGLPGCKPRQEEKTNVILFLVDDLGWTDVGCYGSSFYETPNIDRFAQVGMQFTNAYAASHVCSPTRASLMTGRYPATLHLTDWLPGRSDFPFQRLLNADINQHLPFEEVTIAEALKERGYSTAIYGKWHLGDISSGPLHHGFDIHIPKNWNICCPPNSGYRGPWQLEGLPYVEGDYLTDRLTDEALKYIEENRERPFFLYLSHFAVHDPIDGRPDQVKKYEKRKQEATFPDIAPFLLEGNPDNEVTLTRDELNEIINQPEYKEHKAFPNRTVKIKQIQDNPEFAGMVENIDENFGRVLAKLEELGLEDNTVVIFFSDNGGMSGSNFWDPERVIPDSLLDRAYATSNLPLRGGKGWLYEGGIRVPLIVKWPSHTKEETSCDVPVTSVDLFPTILDMLGFPILDEMHFDGVSFLPLLKGENYLDREAIYWHFPHYSNHGMQSPGGAIRYGDYKLIEYYENGSLQLFNLKDDIGEQNDLAELKPEKARELSEMLHKWLKDVDAQMMSPNPDYSPMK
jgi:arylsulfatase A